jgi:HAMP domain-containing protein
MATQAPDSDGLDHRELLAVLQALERGDFRPRMREGVAGVPSVGADVGRTVNDIMDRTQRFTRAVTEGCAEIGVSGNLGGPWRGGEMPGAWGEAGAAFNTMVQSLTAQVRCLRQVLEGAKGGDYSRLIPVDTRGELLDLKHCVNDLVLRLRAEQESQATASK